MRLFRTGGWADLADKVAEDRALPAPDVQPAFTSWGTSAPLDVSTSNVLRVSDAWACVSLLANSISTLPLHVFRKTDAGRVAAGPDSRVVQLLQRPSPGSTGTDLISQVVTHLAVFGEAFVGLYRSDSEIVQLGLLHPEQVQVALQGQRILYTLSTRNGQVEVGPDDVLHVKGLSVDGLRGLSPVAQCRTALGLSSSLQQSAKTFTEQGSRPSGVLIVPDGTQDQLERVREAWRARHAGVERMHQIAVLSGDVEFKQVAFSQSDAEFLGQRELSTREVARVFGIPAWAVGGSSGDSLTYANTLEQNRALVTHTLRPWATRIERAISNCQSLCPGGLYVQFDFDALLRADAKTRAETYQIALGEQGWLRREEVRELEDLPPEQEAAQ